MIEKRMKDVLDNILVCESPYTIPNIKHVKNSVVIILKISDLITMGLMLIFIVKTSLFFYYNIVGVKSK